MRGEGVITGRTTKGVKYKGKGVRTGGGKSSLQEN